MKTEFNKCFDLVKSIKDEQLKKELLKEMIELESEATLAEIATEQAITIINVLIYMGFGNEDVNKELLYNIQVHYQDFSNLLFIVADYLKNIKDIQNK